MASQASCRRTSPQARLLLQDGVIETQCPELLPRQWVFLLPLQELLGHWLPTALPQARQDVSRTILAGAGHPRSDGYPCDSRCAAAGPRANWPPPPVDGASSSRRKKTHRLSGGFFSAANTWCRWPESNWRPSHYECAALPTELQRRRPTFYKQCTKFASVNANFFAFFSRPGCGPLKIAAFYSAW